MAERGQIGKRSRTTGEASTPNGSNLTASTVTPGSTTNDDSSRGPSRSPRRKRQNRKLDGAGVVKGMKWLARNFGSLRHVWLVASDWCDLLNEKYLSRHGIASVKTPRTFTSWMNKDSSFGGIMVLNKTSEGNDAGWYLNEFNPSGTGGTKKRYYCFGEPNKPLPEEFRPGPRGFTFSTRAEVNNSIEQDALACDDDDETREEVTALGRNDEEVE